MRVSPKHRRTIVAYVSFALICMYQKHALQKHWRTIGWFIDFSLRLKLKSRTLKIKAWSLETVFTIRNCATSGAASWALKVAFIFMWRCCSTQLRIRSLVNLIYPATICIPASTRHGEVLCICFQRMYRGLYTFLKTHATRSFVVMMRHSMRLSSVSVICARCIPRSLAITTIALGAAGFSSEIKQIRKKQWVIHPLLVFRLWGHL